MKQSKCARLLVAICAAVVAAVAFVACGGRSHTHEWSAWTLDTEPTLTEQGKASHTCKADDGGEETVDVPALSDESVWTKDPAQHKDATHTEDGKDVYTSEYGTVEWTIPAFRDHVYGPWTLTQDPTWDETGKAERVCTLCDPASAAKETKNDVPALSDASVWTKDLAQSSPATHTTPGKDVYTSEYGTVTVELAANVNAHTWGPWTLDTEPSLSATGVAHRDCTSCDAGHETKDDVPALNDENVWTKDPAQHKDATHTAKGQDIYTSEYGTVTVELDKDPNHTFGDDWEITQDPTWDAKGWAKHTCTANDGGEETVEIPALNDAEVWTKDLEQSSPATHTQDGKDVYTSVYGTVEVTLSKNNDHVYGPWKLTQDPTWDATGKAERVCTLCDPENPDKQTKDDVPALSDGSVWTKDPEKSKAPSVSVDGQDVYTSEYGEVTVTIPAVGNPMKGKTYSAVEIKTIDDSTFRNNPNMSFATGNLAFDADGAVSDDGTAQWPFSKVKAVSIVDETTGELAITYNTETLKGYIDLATGVIVMQRPGQQFNDVFVLFPDDDNNSIARAEANASAWGTLSNYYTAVEYTYADGHKVGILIHVSDDGESIVFGVDFSDKNGDAITAAECWTKQGYVYIEKDGVPVASFAYDAEEAGMFPLDGLEGEYTLEDGATVLEIGGYGKATYDGKAATYAVLEANRIGLTVTEESGETYYIVTLGDGTYTASKPTVTLTFDLNGHGSLDALTADANISVPYTLPVPANTETHVFGGWAYDKQGEEPVEDPFVPTEAVELHAIWHLKVTVTIYVTPDPEEEEPVEKEVAVGDLWTDIVAGLIADDVIEEKNLYFNGWYVKIGDAKQPLDLDGRTVDEADNGLSLYADWAELSLYVGEYTDGYELWGASNGHARSDYRLSIDAHGAVSGENDDYEFTGYVEEYDAASGMIRFTMSRTGHDDEDAYVYFEPTAGVMVFASYNDSTEAQFTTDIAVMTKYGMVKDGDSLAGFGINVPRDAANQSGSQGYYAHVFAVYDSDSDAKSEVFLLSYDHMLALVTAEDAFGEPYENIAAIKAGRTLVLKDADGEVLLARVAVGGSETFGNHSTTSALDAFVGVYEKAGGETLKLDGAGNALLGDKVGTYTAAAEDAGYTVDLFLTATEEQDGEYYEITLDKAQKSYSSEKPMLTVTLDTDDKDTETENAFAEKTYNKNIPIELPTPTAEGFVFRGWYTDPTCEHAVPGDGEGGYVYTPTEDNATLYAKWLQAVTLTIHFEDEATENETVTLGAGESATVEKPVRAGYKFAGWFTDKDAWEHAWGSEDEASGDTVGTLEASVEIFAKWDPAAPFTGKTYTAIEFDSSNANGGTDSPDKWGYVTWDAYNIAQGSRSPFTDLDVVSYEPETGAMGFKGSGSYASSQYIGVYDETSDIIVMNGKGSYSNPNWQTWSNDIYVLSAKEEYDSFTLAKITSSYWNSGLTRAVTYKIDDENTLNIFLFGDRVYFGVSFKDKAAEGADISAEACYQAPALYVFARDGSEIARFGYDGTTMVALDGLEGSYTESDALALGNLTLNGVDGATFGDGEPAKTGTYVVVDKEAGTIGVYCDGAYYDVTLDKEAQSYTAVKTMVRIVYSSDQGEQPAAEEKNLNIAYELPAPEATATHVFRGWFTDSGLEHPVTLDDGKWTPTVAQYDSPEKAEITLYAKWLEKRTVTVHYDWADLPDQTIVCADGETIEPVVPGYADGKVFKNWHSVTLDGDVWTNDLPITSDLDLYCEWIEAVFGYGEWHGTEVWGSGENGSTGSGGTTQYSFSIEADGKTSGPKSGTFVGGEESGAFTIQTTDGKTYYGFLDAVNKVMIVSYYEKTVDTDYYILVSSDVATYATATDSCHWPGESNGSIKLFTLKLGNDGAKTMAVFIMDGKVWGNVSFDAVPLDPAKPVTTGNAYNAAASLIIKDSTGKEIARFIHDGKKLVESDGLEGTYTVDGGSVTLNGRGGLTWGERSGTYAKQSDGEKFDVFLDAHESDPRAYYEMTLTATGESKTASLEKVMVSVTFTPADGGNIEGKTESLNKYIPVDLPVLTSDTHMTTGWFTDEGHASPVQLNGDGKYVPTETTTLYATVAEKVTVHIVYGEHGPEEDPDVAFAKGTVPDLTPYIPSADGNYVFNGWYNEVGCETEYVPSELSGDITVWCGWMDNPWEITTEGCQKPWKEADGTWTSDTKSGDTSVTSELRIKINAAGTLSFDWEIDLDPGYDHFYVYFNDSSNQQYHKSDKDASGHFEMHIPANTTVILALVLDPYSDSSYLSCTAKVKNISFAAD